MKKSSLLLLVLAAAVFFASCVRDEDLNLLKNPVHVVGQVDPNFGAPVGSGRLTLHDVISMLGSQYTGHVLPGEDVITLVFDTTVVDTLNNMARQNPSTSSYRPMQGMAKSSGGIRRDTTIRYGVDVTLFNDASVDSIIENNISIASLLFSMNAFIKAECPDTVRELVRQYVSASVDSLEIHYTGRDGIVRPFYGFTFEPMPIDTLLNGGRIQKNDIEMKEIINRLPTHIEVSYRFHFRLSPNFFTEHSADENFQAMSDSISKLFVHYTADAHAVFPFDIQAVEVPYDLTIDLSGDSIAQLNIDKILDSIADGIDVQLKDAFLTLSFENGLPMRFNVAAVMVDANGDPVGDTLVRAPIASAATTPLPAPSTSYTASHAVTSNMRIHLGEDQLHALNQAKNIVVKLAAATGDDNAAGHSVAIKQDDYLRVKVYVQIHPSASFDIRLTDRGIIK